MQPEEPTDDSNRIIDVLKAISMYDPNEGYDTDKREDLALFFNEVIMSDSEDSSEFIERFLNSVSSIIKDMGIIDDGERESSDEVDMTPTEDGEEPIADEPPVAGEEPIAGEPPVDGEPAEEEEAIPDNLFSSHDYLTNNANTYLY